MLNGIGGRTIAQAKESMTYAEALQWSAYIKKRGSLNAGLRLEAGFALLATMLSRAHGGKADMDDFMPHFDKPEANIEDVFNMLKKAWGEQKGAKR